AYCHPAFGHVLPATFLKIEVENAVEYQGDISDPQKFGTNPKVTPSGGVRVFSANTLFGDIVSVNGQPVKGIYVGHNTGIALTPTPAPGRAIADTTHASLRTHTFEILTSDGKTVGTIMCTGLDAGPPPPGAPSYGVDTRGN